MKNYLPKKVVILYSYARREDFASEEQYITEAEVKERAGKIAPYFEKKGFSVATLPGNNDLPVALQKNRPDIVLNLVDSIRGQEHLCPTIPALLDLFNIPYIGTGMLGLAINSNKFLTKKLLEQVGLPLPRYQLFTSANEPLDSHLKFPLIAKLNEIHGSVAINADSVSESEGHLRNHLKNLISIYHQPVLVEEFIVGRELTAYLLEGSIRKIYIGEKIFFNQEEKYKIATFDAVWNNLNSYDYIRADGHNVLESFVRNAFNVLKMDDYAKFDIRQDESGRYYFIDCNANPAFGPVETDCAISHILKMYDIDFGEIIRRLLVNAAKDEPGLRNFIFV